HPAILMRSENTGTAAERRLFFLQAFSSRQRFAERALAGGLSRSLIGAWCIFNPVGVRCRSALVDQERGLDQTLQRSRQAPPGKPFCSDGPAVAEIAGGEHSNEKGAALRGKAASHVPRKGLFAPIAPQRQRLESLDLLRRVASRSPSAQP